MKNEILRAIFSVGCLASLSAVSLPAAGQAASPASAPTFSTKAWPQGTPASVGLDEEVLKALDTDIALGKYSLTDSFRIFRCGTEVFARQYQHDYGQLYAKEAKTKGPLNARLTGRYNYYDPEWHPFYHGTVENLLTMTSGMNSEELFYPENSDSPENDFVHMEASDDWVQYAINEPLVEEPGKNFTYSSADTELLAYVFQKETGQDIDAYADKYLFAPLGIKHFWKRHYVGTVDTEGGLYLSGEGLAKLGLLYLKSGLWGGQQIVSADWVGQSVAPHVSMPYTVEWGRLQYGFSWWLYPVNGEYAWVATGFGGQELMVFPRQSLIAVFTGWDLNGADIVPLVPR